MADTDAVAAVDTVPDVKTLTIERDALKLKLDATQVALAEAISAQFEISVKLAAAESRRDVLLTMYQQELETNRCVAREFLYLWWASMRSPDEMLPPTGVLSETTRARLRLQLEEERDRSSPLPKYTDDERKEVQRAIDRWSKYVIERPAKEKP